MRKFVHITLIIDIFALLSSSCSIYHPQSVDIPLINHKGDTRIDASLGMSYWLIPSSFNLNATATRGFNDWLSGQVHANFGGNNFYTQAAPGVYKPLGAHSVVESYVGVGFGGAWNDVVESTSESSSNNDYTYHGTYVLPFVQGNIGWHNLTAAHIDVGIGLKVGSYLPNFKYHELDNNGNIIAGSQFNYTTPNFLVEPQVMLRLGGERLKLNVRLGVAWLSDIFDENSSKSRNLYSDLATVSAGLTFSF